MAKEIKERLADALRDLIDADECWFDHHGYCQAHRLEKPCSNETAKRILADYDAAIKREGRL